MWRDRRRCHRVSPSIRSSPRVSTQSRDCAWQGLGDPFSPRGDDDREGWCLPTARDGTTMVASGEVESGSGGTYTASRGSRPRRCIKREREGLDAAAHQKGVSGSRVSLVQRGQRLRELRLDEDFL
jgi:hypothetical protein